MPNLIIEYTFQHKKSALRPDNQKYGSGTVPVHTDKLPETEEDFKEIARVVFGLIPDCEKLVVNKVYEDPTKITEDEIENFEGETITGEILDDRDS